MIDNSIRDLDLWPIGNCQVSALVDRQGRFIWGCLPRVDGEPVFSALLSDKSYEDPDLDGFWDVELDGCTATTQQYVRNTPILMTRKVDEKGGSIEIIDFCPRFAERGRMYRPVAYARIVKPLSGSPRIRVRLRPASGWGPATEQKLTFGSSHIRFPLAAMPMRLTADASIGLIAQESFFRLERPLHFFFGPDESFNATLGNTLNDMLERTQSGWCQWVRGLAIPLEWQDAVIRSAITLKLCQHEDTGAIVAALTTSIPEHANSGRNWDYRFCWIRDAYYTVQALNRIGALDVLENYLEYLRNVVENAQGGNIQPLYDVRGNAKLDETEAENLSGYRGMGPVRVGNQAYMQVQHDAYGQIILSSVQAFVDQRLFRMSGHDDFEALERVGECAWEMWNQPDAGLWELRTRTHVHTYSAAMCWAACDRLERAARALKLEERAGHWHDRATAIREQVIASAWREESQTMSSTFDGDDRDASLLQLLDMRFFDREDPRFRTTLEAVEKALRRKNTMLRYASEDDFGMPATAFNVCTFWLIEALHLSGRSEEARTLFEEMLAHRTAAGLLSEDIDPETGELWGNYPQTYSLVGIINCAVLLSKPWNEFR